MVINMIKNLKKLRAEAGISQQQLESVGSVTQQSMNEYENHKVEPDIATLIMLADYFECLSRLSYWAYAYTEKNRTY